MQTDHLGLPSFLSLPEVCLQVKPILLKHFEQLVCLLAQQFNAVLYELVLLLVVNKLRLELRLLRRSRHEVAHAVLVGGAATAGI